MMDGWMGVAAGLALMQPAGNRSYDSINNLVTLQTRYVFLFTVTLELAYVRVMSSSASMASKSPQPVTSVLP